MAQAREISITIENQELAQLVSSHGEQAILDVWYKYETVKKNRRTCAVRRNDRIKYALKKVKELEEK